MRPWWATLSDTPFESHETDSDKKFTHAGKVIYKLLAVRTDASSAVNFNMADLRLVRPEEVGEVPMTRMPAFIIHGKAENSGDRKEAETEGALPADIQSDPSSSVADAAAEDLSKSENSSSASESGGGSSNSSSDDDDSDGSDKASLPVGTKVVLTDDYKDFGDAAGGPLKPGLLSKLELESPRTLAIEGRASTQTNTQTHRHRHTFSGSLSLSRSLALALALALSCARAPSLSHVHLHVDTRARR